jgi:hypothetical protein
MHFSPIIVREVKSGLTYVNLNKNKPAFPQNLTYQIIDVTNPATAEFVRARGMKIKPEMQEKGKIESLELQRREQLIYGE